MKKYIYLFIAFLITPLIAMAVNVSVPQSTNPIDMLSGSLNGTGKTISSVLKGKLMRESATSTDTFTGDAYVDFFDCHVEKDTLGSNTEYTK